VPPLRILEMLFKNIVPEFHQASSMNVTFFPLKYFSEVCLAFKNVSVIMLESYQNLKPIAV